MRSRLWVLILRELPAPLRLLGTEIVRLIQWIDSSTSRLILGFRENPAWYFMASIGVFAVFLTFMMFISIIDETSGHRSPASAERTKSSLSREDLEKNHDWSVQDRWRVAHMFVADKPPSRHNDLPIDSRLMSTISPKSKVTRADTYSQFQHASYQPRRPSPSQKLAEADLEVRLELSRPKKAQQGNRMIRDTAKRPFTDRNGKRGEVRIHPREPRLLVQASWDFGTECQQSPVDYVAEQPFRRRPVLVPMPEPELELPPVRKNNQTPMIAFEMAMVRHFSYAGHFPPGSHLVTQSHQFSYPDLEDQYPSSLVSHSENPWQRFQPSRHHNSHNVTAYIPQATYEHRERLHQALDEFDPTLPPVADVALSLSLDVPEFVHAGQPHQSRLVISNEGPDPVSRIEIKDFLAHLHTVVAADPPALADSRLDPETGEREKLLHRELPNLLPRESRQLSLDWVPDGKSRQVHRTHVIAHAEVSTSTEIVAPDVTQPMPSVPPEQLKHHSAVACDIQHLDRVAVGNVVELEITVRNTGDLKLHGVKVRISVPDQLSHREGSTVIFDAGNLPVSGQNRTVIKLSAKKAGEAVNLIHVEADEPVKAHGRMVIEVVDRRKKVDPPAPQKRSFETKEQSSPKPLATINQNSTGTGCCCQKVTIPRLISSDLIQ